MYALRTCYYGIKGAGQLLKSVLKEAWRKSLIFLRLEIQAVGVIVTLSSLYSFVTLDSFTGTADAINTLLCMMIGIGLVFIPEKMKEKRDKKTEEKMMQARIERMCSPYRRYM